MIYPLRAILLFPLSLLAFNASFIGNSKGGLFAYRQIWDEHVDEVKPYAGKLEMVPNPAKDKLRIIATANFDVSSRIRLFDNIGRSYMVPLVGNGKPLMSMYRR